MINLKVSSEHTIDLQLVKTALEESGFCTAFDKMIATAAPHVNLDRAKVLQPLRASLITKTASSGVTLKSMEMYALTSFVTVFARVQ
jgi:hypothetical protein